MARTSLTAMLSTATVDPSRLLAARLGVRIDEFAGLELARIHNHSFAGLAELIDVVALDVLVLDVEDARPIPFAERPELNVADDRLECCPVQVVGDFRLIESAHRADRLRKHLQLSIGKGRPESERVDAG